MTQTVSYQCPTIGALKEAYRKLILSYRYHRDVTFRHTVDSLMEKLDYCLDTLYTQEQTNSLRGVNDDIPLVGKEPALFQELENLLSVAY